MKTLFIISAGKTFEDVEQEFGNFDLWTKGVLGTMTVPCTVLYVDDPQMALPEPQQAAGVVITGSHSMVTDKLEWSERIIAWLPQIVEHGIPVLGICYGHQLLAKAMGGEVGFHPKGIEAGTRAITILESAKDDKLFQWLPEKITGQTFHSQSVLKLPPQAVLLASNSHEPHHAFRVGRHAWGVQFHPEFSQQIMVRYLDKIHGELIKVGKDPLLLSELVSDTPEAQSLGAYFAGLVHEMNLETAA